MTAMLSKKKFQSNQNYRKYLVSVKPCTYILEYPLHILSSEGLQVLVSFLADVIHKSGG